jgi:hypothetical protein
MIQDFVESNKIFAQFMGYKYYGHNDPELENGKYPPGWKTGPTVSNFTKLNKHGDYLCRNHNQLSYHRLWDKWLMEVIYKIESLDKGIYETIMYSSSFYIQRPSTNVKFIGTGKKIHAAYECIVEFIKWYSIQTKQNDEVQS